MTEHVVDEIAEYVDGKVTPGRAREIEEHLGTCSECAADVAYVRAFRESAMQQGLMHIRESRIVELAAPGATPDDVETQHLAACDACRRELDWAQGEVESDGDAVSAPGNRRGWFSTRWAPPALALAAIVLIVFLVPRDAGIDDVRAAARLEPIPVNITRSTERPDDRMRGLERYRDGSYARAREHLVRALALRGAGDAELLLYLGSSALLAGDPAAAARHLSVAAADTTSSDALRTEARWQLANAHVALGEIESATAVLEAIEAARGARAEDATALLGEIR